MGKLYLSGIVPEVTVPSTLPSIGTALNDMTWEEVRAISDAGLAADYFAVGDKKTIVINGTVGNTTFSNLSIDVFILGFDHNSAIEGTNTIHFKIGKINGTQVAFCDSSYGGTTTVTGNFIMNTASDVACGWESGQMRSNVLGSDSIPSSPTSNTLLAALPSDLISVMKQVTKYTDNTGNGTDTASHVTSTTDCLFLLSEYELFGVDSWSNSAEKNYQAQYDYYKAGNSNIHYKHKSASDAAHAWCRSPSMNGSGNFCGVTTSGGHVNTDGDISFGISPAFVV